MPLLDQDCGLAFLGFLTDCNSDSSTNCSREKGKRHSAFSKLTQGYFENIGQCVTVKYVGDALLTSSINIRNVLRPGSCIAHTGLANA